MYSLWGQPLTTDTDIDAKLCQAAGISRRPTPDDPAHGPRGTSGLTHNKSANASTTNHRTLAQQISER